MSGSLSGEPRSIRSRTWPSKLHDEPGMSLRASDCQHVVSNDPTRGLASHHGASCLKRSEQDRCGAEHGGGGPGEGVRMAWHARGQGFKSPQLHPRSEAPCGLDRPRFARLGQQIGSNLLSKADPVVRHGGDAVQHRRCRRPTGPGLTGPPGWSGEAATKDRIGRARQGRSRSRPWDSLLAKPDQARSLPAMAGNRAGRGRRGVVRGCPLGTGRDRCEWHASGTAGEMTRAHGDTGGSNLTVA
jgi:hypothetical protein